MTYRGLSSRSIRISGALLAGLLVLGLIGPVRRVRGSHQWGSYHALAPISVGPGHALRLSLINRGSKPVGIRLLFLNGTDLSPVASDSPVVLGPRTGHFFGWAAFPGGLVTPAVELQGQPDPDAIRLSVQMFNSAGQTVAYADGDTATHEVGN